MSYKLRLLAELINRAKIYKSVFMDYDYLIYSNHFTVEPYYIINAIDGNFAHLTGVKPIISASDFYYACLNSTLQEAHFTYIDKGSVHRKIKAFLNLQYLFFNNFQVEEIFSKGSIRCAIGTSDGQITVGFAKSVDVNPMTLLKGNQFDQSKAVDISLVLRRNKGTKNSTQLFKAIFIDFT